MKYICELNIDDVITLIANTYNCDPNNITITAKNLQEFKIHIDLGPSKPVEIDKQAKEETKTKHVISTTVEADVYNVKANSDSSYYEITDNAIAEHINNGGDVKSLCKAYNLNYKEYKFKFYERIKRLRREGVSIRSFRAKHS